MALGSPIGGNDPQATTLWDEDAIRPGQILAVSSAVENGNDSVGSSGFGVPGFDRIRKMGKDDVRNRSEFLADTHLPERGGRIWFCIGTREPIRAVVRSGSDLAAETVGVTDFDRIGSDTGRKSNASTYGIH